MSDKTFTSGPIANTARTADGKLLTAPDGWILLPGDAALTRRVKSAGEHSVVAEKKGRRVLSLGFGQRRRPPTTCHFPVIGSS